MAVTGLVVLPRHCRDSPPFWPLPHPFSGQSRESPSVHHHTGGGTDEQPGGTSHPVRGDRPAHHPRDAWGGGPELVRADLDGDRQLCGTRSVGVCLSAGGGASVFPQDSSAVVAVPGELTGTHHSACRRRCKVVRDREVGAGHAKSDEKTSEQGESLRCGRGQGEVGPLRALTRKCWQRSPCAQTAQKT